MEHSFVAFTATKVDLLKKRGWRFTPMSINENPTPAKGTIFVMMNGKRYRATKREYVAS